MKTLLLVLALVSGARAAEVEPIVELKALGGQYFFRSRSASVSGDASALGAAAVRVSPKWTLIPSISAAYQGTKQVMDLAGGGTLFQERQAYRAGLRGVYERPGSPWRLKPFMSLRWELLKETRDESWGRGLFDHRQWDAGAEAEYVWNEPYSARVSLGYFSAVFPNYDSLETRGDAAAFGLVRANAGRRLLDSRGVHASASFDAPVGERLVGSAGISEVYSRFPEQRVIAPSGLLTDNAREDLLTTLNGSLRMPFAPRADVRGVLDLSAAWGFRSSTQNGYEASRGEFYRLAENYSDWRLGPSLRLLVGPSRRPKQAWGGLDLSTRKYPHRPAQDARGVYGLGPLTMSSVRLYAGGAWPITERFSLMASADWTRASSNQDFEALYPYRYTATNYLFGFTFEY